MSYDPDFVRMMEALRDQGFFRDFPPTDPSKVITDPVARSQEITKIIMAKDLVSNFHEDLQNYLDSFQIRRDAKPEEILMVNALHGAVKMYQAEKEKVKKLEQEIATLKRNAQAVDSDNSDDADRKEKKKKANKLAEIRTKLKQGKITDNMYLYLKTECDTKTTQNNIVKAFIAYQHAKDPSKAPNEDLSFEDMLTEMEKILSPAK